jgi:hypothetical protein
VTTFPKVAGYGGTNVTAVNAAGDVPPSAAIFNRDGMFESPVFAVVIGSS